MRSLALPTLTLLLPLSLPHTDDDFLFHVDTWVRPQRSGCWVREAREADYLRTCCWEDLLFSSSPPLLLSFLSGFILVSGLIFAMSPHDIQCSLSYCNHCRESAPLPNGRVNKYSECGRGSSPAIQRIVHQWTDQPDNHRLIYTRFWLMYAANRDL